MNNLWLVLLASGVVAVTAQTDAEYEQMAATVARLDTMMKMTIRQVMLEQYYRQEQIRSRGNSGLKRVRLSKQGSRPYYATTHASRSVAAIHEHVNNDRTVGMGELLVVMNGVEFRTRHNDYRLYMPSTTNSDYHATEEVPFPEVPQEVLDKPTVQDQILEMREWFRAWQDQNSTVRDYREYFKPVLCYLEGAWTLAGDEIEEGFASDRHFIDATTWQELYDKNLFMSATGRKDALENVAFLPGIFATMYNDDPVYAQWNYRILCHPVSRDIPLNRLRPENDFGPRMTQRDTLQELMDSRAARFSLNSLDSNNFVDGEDSYGLLDEIMYEIPGKDNYPAHLRDNAFGDDAYKYDDNTILNAGYYHRAYLSAKSGAMGVTTRRRSFSDENCFFAGTQSANIVPFKINDCQKDGSCTEYEQRWTYAIPLEIIYLTPLSKWNPYNIQYHGKAGTEEGNIVIANDRNGELTIDKAYDGTNSKYFYQTPYSFFSGTEDEDVDPADTAEVGGVGVLDESGELRHVVASGTRIFFPEIEDVGKPRQRYPIMPIFGQGDPAWKELEALKDMVEYPSDFQYMYNNTLRNIPRPFQGYPSMALKTGFSEGGANAHYHDVDLNPSQVGEIVNGGTVTVMTGEAASHSHQLEMRCSKVVGDECRRVKTVNCGSEGRECSDGHPRNLVGRN